ncbi:acetyltransferase [Cunninghamella echinulata]|nr:acetyltransferase [Cunninghamella echinulata]
MIDIIIIQDKNRKEDDIEKLLLLWEQSVKATHDFLPIQHITSLIELVKKGLKEIDSLLVAQDKNNSMLGFMGIEKNKIEMLFIHPHYLGKGIGKQLVHYAFDLYDINYVDVNEQNKKALGFYKSLGFIVSDRSEFDGQGKPFPILHLKKFIE